MRSAGQVVSAQLGGHVSSSTMSAHQMARAGEPADSDGSIEWVKLHVGETDQTNCWNRRSGRPLGARRRVSRSSGWEGQVTEAWCGTSTRSLVTLRMHSLRCFLGDGPLGEGLGIPSPLLGCHQVRGAHRAPVMDVPVSLR